MAIGEGSHTITAVATDAKGATTVSAPVTVTGIANQLPVVTLVAPIADHVVVSETPVDIALKATATDADGGIAAVRFYARAQPIGDVDAPTLLATLGAPPYEAVWSGVPQTGASVDGQWIEYFEVWAEATDVAGATEVSNYANVRVVASMPRDGDDHDAARIGPGLRGIRVAGHHRAERSRKPADGIRAHRRCGVRGGRRRRSRPRRSTLPTASTWPRGATSPKA